MDFYGGYKATFGDFGLDVGAHLLLLPRARAPTRLKINNCEIYVGG